MKTHLGSGEPYDIENLVASFASRVEVLSDLAEFATAGREVNQLTETLARAIGNLRDDWEICEKALEVRADELYNKIADATGNPQEEGTR